MYTHTHSRATSRNVHRNPFSQFRSLHFSFDLTHCQPPLCLSFSPLYLIGVADPNLAPAFDLKTKLIDEEEDA